MNIDHTNQVKIAVRPEIPIEVLTIVFAAKAPATPVSYTHLTLPTIAGV